MDRRRPSPRRGCFAEEFSGTGGTLTDILGVGFGGGGGTALRAGVLSGNVPTAKQQKRPASWAKGKFKVAGKVPGTDFLYPSTPDEDLHNVDNFAMFAAEGDDTIADQNLLAELTVDPNFQKVFNMNHGSILVRTDVALDEFDFFAILSAADMDADI